MNTEVHRPAGLVVVVVITAVFAAFGLFLCGLGIVAVSTGKASLGEALIILACFALSIAEVVTCFGLWKREDWGYSLAQTVYVLNILSGAIGIFWSQALSDAVVGLVSIGAYVWMFIYVTGLKGAAPLSASTPYNRERPSTHPRI